jgi:hypothetical protein
MTESSGIYEGDPLEQIIANNRAGGWRKLKEH